MYDVLVLKNYIEMVQVDGNFNLSLALFSPVVNSNQHHWDKPDKRVKAREDVE